MPAYTPGPWSYVDATKSASYKFAPTCVIKAGDVQIASFSWNDNSPWFPTQSQSQANARLIAAAPDLLHALFCLVDWVEDHSVKPGEIPEIISARAALAKAFQKGENE